jgi:hypothetical protein
LNKSAESGHPCFIFDFRGNSLSFYFHWVWFCLCVCRIYPILCWDIILLYLVCSGIFSWRNVEFYSMLFLHF